MTECERIITQGILPESFFEEEIRCGFLVSEKRKKIWAVELDLYLKFQEVCNKHHLTFWGDGGTLLGAVRHNGYIPWDDDLDLIMPREDYDRLMRIAPAEFTGQYFYQTPHTDPNYGYSFAKLRNSNTTCMPEVFAKAGFNHGIPIDIFPLDEICLDTFDENNDRIKDCIMKCSSYMKRNSIDLLNEHQLQNFKKYWTDNPAHEFDLIQQIASNPKHKGSLFVSDSVVTTFSTKARIWKKAWYDKTVWHSFETVDLPMPAAVDERLKAQYGDYMVFPPAEERGVWHPGVLWDPDKPYLEYVNN